MPEPSSMMAGPPGGEIMLEKNAGLIMGTNNSSIVSKRSVERLYLPAPHFYRYFVRKPQRRSPTINRGYWLRMRAVDWTVRQFLEKASNLTKVVVNLGCGYDPLPFQWMARDNNLCQGVKFIDVDYEELMTSKRQIIQNTPEMCNMLKSLSSDNTEQSVLLDSAEYAAIGCDLRNLPRLKKLIDSVIDLQHCVLLFVAEVSITYMHTGPANELIAWTSTLSTDVTFCLLEQGSPDRPDHPFTSTMMKHFNKLGTPLHSVFEYPGFHTQALRFQQAGFTHCETQNLWQLWSDPRFLSPSQRLALDSIEPFDEWEEFALFASHYLLVVAHNRPEPVMMDPRSSRRDSIDSMESDISARTASPYRAGTQWFAMKHCEEQADETKRHHGSAYQVPKQDAVAVYGGIGPKARLATTVVCKPRQAQHSAITVLSPENGPRCCHTVTTLTNGANILIGGRGSPNQPMKDCWLQVDDEWFRIHDLPEPRYRHRTVPVTLPDNAYGAVVFGGKTGPSHVAIDVLLWDPRKGWSVLPSLNQDPLPRFGASFVHLGFNHGLLFGGMRQDGVICQGLWRWRMVIRENKVAGISFRSSKALDATVGTYPWFSRLGATWDLARDELLIIGGVAKSGCIPKPFEIMSLLGSFSAFLDHEKEMRLRLTCVEPKVSSECPRPLMVGHSTHRTVTGMLVFMGGGATCFSFGNFYNSGIWILHEKEAGLHIDWTLAQTTAAKPDAAAPPSEKDHSILDTKPAVAVKQGDITSADDFVRIVKESQPMSLRALPLGSCLQDWIPDYFLNRIDSKRKIVIHSSPTRNMNFQRKDFTYETLTFADFIRLWTSPKSHVYLRALSTASPSTSVADFESDWPELAQDIQIPSHLSSILSQTKHSSCLRMSNNITMWLHYDVMANVLFQIHGIKKLVLFPPSDLTSLSFPPGSTTSEIDIFKFPHRTETQNNDVEQDDTTTIITPPGTTPHAIILHPGDALFIPPLWAHTGISLKHENTTTTTVVNPAMNQYTNISLNVFFRSLPLKQYAHGRDIYGNRDLAAYEDGRRDIDRLVTRFLLNSNGSSKTATNMTKNSMIVSKHTDNGSEAANHNKEVATEQWSNGIMQSIPKNVAKAYLERLADELRKKANEL